jgi:hypothetical protein
MDYLEAPVMPAYADGPPPSNSTAEAITPTVPAALVTLPASTASSMTDTVVLFELDGREYRVPARPRAVVALRYLRAVRDKGTDVAAATLLTELLGVDGFDALCEYEDLTADQFKSIMTAAQKLTMGAMEEAFGGNSPGSKR